MKKILVLLVALTLALPTTTLHAGEGMWIPLLMKKLNYKDMKKAGLKLSAKDLYDVNHGSLKDAIVSFGGFCTGEVISSEGLLLTNHHCGYDAIQKHSTVENNYLADGFWAMTRAEELPNPGLFVNFLVRIEDVTKDMNKVLKDNMSEAERADAVAEKAQELIAKATAGTEYDADVESFYHGNEFYLFVYHKFNDVRLVGAPPSSVGKYGGDTDNWMWPRHTGDFSMFRVYMGKDGKGADYSADNVPLTPKHHLPISMKGVNDGDFAMVWGYPGSTDRYLSSWGVQQAVDIYNPTVVEIRDVKLEVLRGYMQADPALNILLASSYAQTANYWKYFIGQTEQLVNNHVYEKKANLEAQFAAWVAADPKRQAKYGETLTLMQKFYAATDPTVKNQVYLMEAVIRGPSPVLFAYRTGRLLEKAEDTRAWENLRGRVAELGEAYFEEFVAEVDRDLIGQLWTLYLKEVPVEQIPDFIKNAFVEYGDMETYAEYCYSNSIFFNEDRFFQFMAEPDTSLLMSDPMYKAAMGFREAYFGGQDPELAEMEGKAYRLWTAGVREMLPNEDWSPDANSTMRMTFGKVGSYEPKDGVIYNYYTTLDGVMQKEDASNPEFEVPQRLKDLYNAKDYGQYADANGKLPVGLITDNDITGGNSGSPLINGKGELIGVAFDGNWEAMSGDIFFEDELQRTISVDIRYVLFIVDKYAGARHLVDEMTLHF